MKNNSNKDFIDLELQRKSEFRKISILQWSSLILFIAYISILAYSVLRFDFSLNPLSFVFSFAFVIIFAFAAELKKKLTSKIKDQYVRILIEKSGYKNVTYNIDSRLNSNYVNGKNYLRRPDRFTSSDEITGNVDGNDFLFSNVRLESRRTDSNGNTSYSTYFMGPWIEISLPRSIKGKIEIIEKRGVTSRSEKELEKFNTESINFNNKFNSFASDQSEYYKLMTFKKIEDLSLLERAVAGHFSIYYNGSRLTVLLNTKRYFFQPKISVSLLSEENQTKIKKEIEILRLINKLTVND